MQTLEAYVPRENTGTSALEWTVRDAVAVPARPHWTASGIAVRKHGCSSVPLDAADVPVRRLYTETWDALQSEPE